MRKSFVKYLLPAVFFVFVIQQLSAQEKTEINYVDNFTSAQEKAQATGKKILLVFSGSDWCKPCIIFDNNILKDSMFITYSNENLIVYKADFPRRKQNLLSKEKQKENDMLASKYNKNGQFPRVLLFSPDSELKAILQFNNVTVEEFISQIKKF